MKVSTSLAENEVAVLEVQGDIDAHTSHTLDRALGNLLAQGHRRLALDVSEVGFVSSAGLRSVLLAHQEALQHGGQVRLFGLSAPVRRVFEMAGFDEFLHLCHTRQEALEGW